MAAQLVIDQQGEQLPDLQLQPLDQDEMDSIMNDLLEDQNVSDFFKNFEFEFDNAPLW